MDYTNRLEQANDIPDAQPVTGQYDENAIRVGVLEGLLEKHKATIALQAAEIERLLGCIAELEREGIEPPARCEHDLPRGCCAVCQTKRKMAEEPHRGFRNFDAWANAVEHSERPHHFERGGIEN